MPFSRERLPSQYLRMQGDACQFRTSARQFRLAKPALPAAVRAEDPSRAQAVRAVTVEMKAKGAKQPEAFPRNDCHRGRFEVQAPADRFQRRHVLVHPGVALCLRSRYRRSEHWTEAWAPARGAVAKTAKRATEMQSVHMPLGAIHGTENPGKVPMVLVEAHAKAGMSEDEGIRYEDVVARGQGAKG